MIHNTNRPVDLQPVVQGAANRYSWFAAKLHAETIAERAQARCDWMIVTRDGTPFQTEEWQTAIRATENSPRAPQLWTDRFNNVVGILK